MQTVTNGTGLGGTVGIAPATESERKLTREELLDYIGPYATKGDHLTREEREAYAIQLADMLYPDKPAGHAAAVRLWCITKADRLAMAEASIQRAKPARQPPPGKTWYETIRGQWPGDETDEEIRAMLDEIS